jgi:hypothetical protein
VVEDLLHQDRNHEVAHDGAERDDDRENETRRSSGLSRSPAIRTRHAL